MFFVYTTSILSTISLLYEYINYQITNRMTCHFSDDLFKH